MSDPSPRPVAPPKRRPAPPSRWTSFFRRESAGLERLLFALVPAFLVGGIVVVVAGGRAGLLTIVLIAIVGVLASKRLFRP